MLGYLEDQFETELARSIPLSGTTWFLHTLTAVGLLIGNRG